MLPFCHQLFPPHTYMWLVAFHLRGAPTFIRPVAVLGSGAAAANRVTNYYTLDIGRGRNRNKVCVRVGVGEERALPAERLFVNKDHFVLLEHQPGEMCCCCEVSSEAVGINSWNSHPKHQRIKIVCVDIYWRQLNMQNSIGGEYKAVKYVQRNELQQFLLGNFHHTLRPTLIGILSPLKQNKLRAKMHSVRFHVV